MEANEIMTNEEVMETTTEEIVKASSVSGFKTAAAFGLVFLAGYAAGKYIIDPTIARIKARKQSKQSIAVAEEVTADKPSEEPIVAEGEAVEEDPE